MCFKTPKVPTTAAAPVTAPSADVSQNTNVDTVGQALKRKARGKTGLTIAANFSGGTSNGGTGLNI